MAEKGAGRALLEVRFDNAAAIALYRTFGFETMTVRRDYYGPGVDAWVMGRPLTGISLATMPLTENSLDTMPPGNVAEKEVVGGIR